MIAPEAEFDRYAEDYRDMLARSVAISGEAPEFFHRYKIAAVREWADRAGLAPRRILDFGSGTGNSVPHLREMFPSCELLCADTSARSLAIAQQRHPGAVGSLLVAPGAPLDLPDGAVDLCFSACVFHHIDHAEHGFWLGELRRVTRPGGALVIFEHNPFNPLTQRAVRTCPFDENARLVRPRALARRVCEAGWRDPAVVFRLFFPGFLARLRPVEARLARVPLGAQYSVHAMKDDG